MSKGLREIKFRAWDKVHNIMRGTNNTYNVCVSGDIIVVVKYKPVPNGTWQPEYCKQLDWNQCKNFIVMQYTGLKDKNGVEIYEGDVVARRGNTTRELIGKVIYQEDRFWFLGEHGGYNFYYSDDDIEVIGNIYENPELLEKL